MDLPELERDARFATFQSRQEHVDAMKQPIIARMKERTTADWIERFTAEGVFAGRINDYGMWLDEPQVAATHAADEITVTGEAKLPVPRTPGRVPVTRPAPKTGQDTERVLKEFSIEG